MNIFPNYILLVACLFFISLNSKADIFAYIPDHVGVQNQHGLLHVVNASYDVKVETIELFGNPRDIYINKTGDTVFVSTEVEDDGEEESYINLIDTSTNKRVGLIAVEQGSFVRGMAMNSTESKLYVTHDRGVTEISNPYSLDPQLKEFTTNYRGTSLVISNDDQYLFVLGQDGNGVDGISLISFDDAINDEIRTGLRLGSGKGASSIIYLDLENELYVTNRGSDELVLLEVQNYADPLQADLNLVDTLRFEDGASPSDIVYDEEHDELLVSLSFILDERDSTGNGYIAVLNAFDFHQQPARGLSKIFLWDEGGIDNVFDPIHPTAISLDEFGSIHVIKHIWNEHTGMYLARLKDSTNNGIRTVQEAKSVKLGEQSATLISGTFIGPDCSSCPTGLDHNPNEETKRPSSMDFQTIAMLLVVLLIGAGMRRFGKNYHIR